MTSPITEIPLKTLSLERFEPVLNASRREQLRFHAERTRTLLAGRTFWNLNSTAKGGGVAEMLASLLPYARGAGIETRWLVIDGTEDFFTISKRIHNQLHGNDGDGEDLGKDARRIYEHALAENERDLSDLIRPGDVVLFHDPQTAGLVSVAESCGATAVWRCHVGVDVPNDRARSAWSFLRPYVDEAERCIFTCRKHVWEGLDPDRIVIVAPSIDTFTPKNQELGDATVAAILTAAGISDGDAGSDVDPAYVSRTGQQLTVKRRAVVSQPIPLGRPLIVQVSRWDSLKDPIGVMTGFADYVAPYGDAHLVLAGPDPDSIDDDPDQAETFECVTTTWKRLSQAVRRRVHLVSLPMDDEDENAAMVNALQRRADVVVQKSLAEGFGLTVAEAMWKRRPVVASARGGITEQITDNDNGVLVQDPEDLEELGGALRGVLDGPERAARLGEAAHRTVCDHFLAPRELVQHFEFVEELLGPAGR